MRQPTANEAPVGTCRVRALYSWSGESKDDLGFVEGDLIDVLNVGDGNWWTGRLKRNRVVGLFPRNFVEYVNNDQETVEKPSSLVSDLGISDPLGASGGSTKSTEEILKEVSNEVNRNFLDNIELDAHPDDLGDVLKSHDPMEDAPPPIPPPHRILKSSQNSRESNIDKEQFSELGVQKRQSASTSPSENDSQLLQRVVPSSSSSPDLGDVPFDPQAFKTTEMPSANPPKKESSFKKLVRRSSVSLQRMSSRSSRSSKSSHKSLKGIGNKLRKLKFWDFNQDDDDNDIYPTNELSRYRTSEPSPQQDLLGARQSLYRTKTMTSREKQLRLQRMELQGISAADPIALIPKLEFHDFRLENWDHVDTLVESESWPRLMTPSVLASSRISRRFNDEFDRIRAVWMLCATQISYSAERVGNIMQTCKASPLELANVVHEMLTTLDVENIVVQGHLRYGNQHHAWNAVCIAGGEWRFLDASVASPTFPGSSELSGFWFLVPPHQMIWSHLPTDATHQFLEPPLPTAMAASLPLADPAAFAHGVEFVGFHPGLVRLIDYETCELVLRVPSPSTDLVANVVLSGAEGDDAGGSALAQCFHCDEERLFRIKAVLNPGVEKATLQIWAADRSEVRRTPYEMEQLYQVVLRHSGRNDPYEFVARYASPRAVDQDIYVQEPQCRRLAGGETYKFVFEQFALRSSLGALHLGIQSPSGRVTRLVQRGTGSHDTWRATVKTMEVGTWRSVVSADDGEDWISFGEWFCA